MSSNELLVHLLIRRGDTPGSIKVEHFQWDGVGLAASE